MKVVIHGGMFKTGTTSLQSSLAQSSDLLETEGIIYPLTSINQHSVLLNARNPKWNTDILNELAVSANKKGFHTLLLSGESVCALSKPQLTQLIACFKPYPVELVFTFRHWAGYLPSRWKQSCLRRDSQPFDNYLHNVLTPSLNHFDIHFDKILTNAKESGVSKLKSISWENALMASQDVGMTVLDSIGLSKNLIEKVLSPKWENKSKPLLFVETCRILNGLMDIKYSLKQNELFWSYANHTECTQFHDIVHIMPAINLELKSKLEARLMEIGMKKTKFPDFGQFEHKLSYLHADTFVNLMNGKIFWHTSENQNTFDHYTAVSDNFTDLMKTDYFADFERLYFSKK